MHYINNQQSYSPFLFSRHPILVTHASNAAAIGEKEKKCTRVKKSYTGKNEGREQFSHEKEDKIYRE
jgi:hypothetical protein